MGVPCAVVGTPAVAPWRVREDHQLAKQSTGPDAGQIIRWTSWHRWTASCLLACIYIAVAAAPRRWEAYAGITR
jgi:hypothetical protein